MEAISKVGFFVRTRHREVRNRSLLNVNKDSEPNDNAVMAKQPAFEMASNKVLNLFDD